MKAFNLVKVAALVAVFTTGVAAAVFAEPPNAQYSYKYVMVTGSMIPQRVKVKPIGTATMSNLRVYDRREIDKTGRFTTEGVLAQDPSLRVRPGG